MRLIIADDHTLFRDALVQYIMRANPDADIDIAKDFDEVIVLMDEDPDYDLVVLDLRMPGMNGLDGFREMNEKYPDTPTALMSGLAEPQDVKDAMALGAAGYFPKTLSGKALLQAIERVLGGEQYMPKDETTNKIMPSYYNDHEPDVKMNGHSVNMDGDAGMMNLTQREGEVLRFLLEGASNKEIANALGLQLVTVKLHVRGICRKMGAKNRTQAALKAQAIGFAQ